MGTNIDRERFTASDMKRFTARLHESLAVLRELLDQPSFGRGAPSLGAELETYIADDNGRVLPLNQRLIDEMQDPQVQLELNRFNIEYNLTPLPLAGAPFAALERQLVAALARLQGAATPHGGHIVPIGILPTLTRADLGAHAMSDSRRFRAMERQLKALRGEAFSIEIHGQDRLALKSSHVALEGANTSFQLHLRVEPERFADTFNTIQLITPLVLALAANSPLFLKQRLWDETRIALFKQSVDDRQRGSDAWRRPSRVAFGQGWVRRGAWELFAETVALHPPLLPVLGDTAPGAWRPGDPAPALGELRLHMGTVWPWNRAVYDPADGGHLRIEMRALPAGPTPRDMAANSALLLGLALGLRDDIEARLSALPFHYAEYNFYRAAQQGLSARLLWPHRQHHRLEEMPLATLLEDLLPHARAGLMAGGVSPADADAFLAVSEARLAARTSGATWQRGMLAAFEARGLSRSKACRHMLGRYRHEAATQRPVADWSTEA
ncbi:glutamate--cysteine ligase [Halomonas sp. YLGW01]|uniref:glutamate--cysteine ligase n=1 Tax=Halomonas sp. YLGW01 TaxID=2773308 RepID=UPI0017860235|nr:glutamate--cysteine ligase [Halomonas sp. YLGW01]